MNLKKTMTITWALALLLPLMLPYIQNRTRIQADRGTEIRPYNNTVAIQTETTSTVHHSGLPKVDEILFKAYPGSPPEDIVDEFLAGETDWIGGPARSDLYKNVTTAGHKVSPMDPEAEFNFIQINCRDYKETSGEPNLPLNDSNFRIALSYIYGMDRKQADIYDYYGTNWTYAIGNPVPPAQEPGYNESIQMPDTNWSKAWSILETAGYYVDPTENWLYRNGIKMRDLITHYSGCGGRPWRGFVETFNEFITTHLGADGPTMGLHPRDFTSFIMDILVYHDFDFGAIGLTNMGRYVDWLYDCLHSDNDVPWGWNFPGIHDSDFDNWTDTILTSLDMQETVEVASKIQEKFVYELLPWIPMTSGKTFCTTVRDDRGELMNVISMPNFGPMNQLSYMAIHWKGEPGVAWPGGNVTVAMGDEPDTLNPWTDDTRWGWQMLDRAITGLTMVEPVNLTDMPFIATGWEIMHWTSIPELGIVNGSTATFWLRQDVKWHDGEPVTAYDCVANMRFMREYQPPRYSSTWAHLVYSEADGPYKFNTYFDQTSLYYAGYVAGTSLLVPEEIIEVVEDYWYTWEPCFNAYAGLGLGPPPPDYPDLTQLVGCGPFVFDYYDRDQAIGRVERYQDFFVNAPVIGSVVGEWRVNPLDSYTYESLVQNMAAMEADENGSLTDVTVDVKIYEDNVLAHEIDGLHLDPWNWTYLGPYTIESVACGPHNITVEVYDHTNSTLLHSYTHTFVATVREDLTTYTGQLIDFAVDMRDIGRAARAFGSSPGHLRWDPACDVNQDFTVDMRDIGNTARKFGWHR